jgi:hypothetical protein
MRAAFFIVLSLAFLFLVGGGVASFMLFQRLTEAKEQAQLLNHELTKEQSARADLEAKLQTVQDQLSKLQAQIAQAQEAAEKQQQSLPIQIVTCLNDLVSATETGINKDTYTEKITALKTAVMTYGGNLSKDAIASLQSIIDMHSLALHLLIDSDNEPPNPTTFDPNNGLIMRLDPNNDPEDKSILDVLSQHKAFVEPSRQDANDTRMYINRKDSISLLLKLADQLTLTFLNSQHAG